MTSCSINFRRSQLWLCIIFLPMLVASLTLCSNLAAQTATNAAASGVPLRFMNREVFVFRATVGPYTPEQRAAATAALFEKLKPVAGRAKVESEIKEQTAEIKVDGHVVFRITPGDIQELQGESLESVLQQTTNRLNLVLGEFGELRDRRSLLIAVVTGTGATLMLIGLIWVMVRNRQWVKGRLIRLTAGKADRLKSHTLRMVGLQNVVPLLNGLITASFWVVVGLATYFWLEYILRLFPLTRPLGEQLGARFLILLAGFGQSVLRAVPDLCIVFLVWLLARFASSAARRFFTSVARGNIKSGLFDSVTAPITQKLCVSMIWITAIIVAFPYIPGSQTPAFRGVSVLAGLMISLGSANLVAQLVGGLIVVYNRTCRVGDYVRVGEFEGTLTSIGVFSSRLLTIRNEEIIVPNTQFSGGVLINYSRLNETVGVVLPVKITIGYDTPWRQVHAMLHEAARRTQGLKQRSETAVLQNALNDFYVEYQLNVVPENQARRILLLSELNANIQDVFNEYGVQIMSPHFMANPPQPVVVPKTKWHEPPATPPV